MVARTAAAMVVVREELKVAAWEDKRGELKEEAAVGEMVEALGVPSAVRKEDSMEEVEAARKVAKTAVAMEEGMEAERADPKEELRVGEGAESKGAVMAGRLVARKVDDRVVVMGGQRVAIAVGVKGEALEVVKVVEAAVEEAGAVKAPVLAHQSDGTGGTAASRWRAPRTRARCSQGRESCARRRRRPRRSVSRPSQRCPPTRPPPASRRPATLRRGTRHCQRSSRARASCCSRRPCRRPRRPRRRARRLSLTSRPREAGRGSQPRGAPSSACLRAR